MSLYSESVENGTKVYSNGAKSSSIPFAFHLVPASALAITAQVLDEGAKKYGRMNWEKLPVYDNVNHALRHLYAVMKPMQQHWTENPEKDDPKFTEQDLIELSHAACRVLFALDQVCNRLVESKKTNE